MKAKACALGVCALLLTTFVTGCGQSIPKTKANLALCAELAKVLSHKAPVIALTVATFESNAPVTTRLRQEVGQYVVDVHEYSENSAHDAAKAESDCASIGAPTAGGYG